MSKLKQKTMSKQKRETGGIFISNEKMIIDRDVLEIKVLVKEETTEIFFISGKNMPERISVNFDNEYFNGTIFLKGI